MIKIENLKCHFYRNGIYAIYNIECIPCLRKCHVYLHLLLPFSMLFLLLAYASRSCYQFSLHMTQFCVRFILCFCRSLPLYRLAVHFDSIHFHPTMQWRAFSTQFFHLNHFQWMEYIQFILRLWAAKKNERDDFILNDCNVTHRYYYIKTLCAFYPYIYMRIVEVFAITIENVTTCVGCTCLYFT